MIVKNEERRLQACLDSVRGLVDEIIVVDTGSTDSTPLIAARNGAVVIPHEFGYVDFAAARNRALESADGRWLLSLDADETLTGTALPRIREIVASNADATNAGYYFERHNQGTVPGGCPIDYSVRLFPNFRNYQYRGRVHETLDASILAGGGRLYRTDIRIDHAVPDDPEARRRKNHWYIGVLKEELAANPNDDSRLDFLAAEYHQLGKFLEATQVAECIAQVRPLDPSAHLNAGIYHMMFTSEPVRARADFSRALELKPDYPEAASFLHTLNERECLSSAANG